MMFQDPVSSLSPRRTVQSLITEPFVVHGMKERISARKPQRLLALVGLAAGFRQPLSASTVGRPGAARRRCPRHRAQSESSSSPMSRRPGSMFRFRAKSSIFCHDLQGEFGLTYVIITHNLAVVRHVSDETAIMYMGRFVEKGPTAGYLPAPAHPLHSGLIAAQPNPDPARRRTGPVLTGEVAACATGRLAANSIRAAPGSAIFAAGAAVIALRIAL